MSNLQALKDMMELQEVKYELPFQQLSFATDVPVLVLSEGNSMLPVRRARARASQRHLERAPDAHDA